MVIKAAVKATLVVSKVEVTMALTMKATMVVAKVEATIGLAMKKTMGSGKSGSDNESDK